MAKTNSIFEVLIVLLGINILTYVSTAPTKKCSVIKTGQYFDGSTGSRNDNIKSSSDCQALCENDKACYGYQYQGSSSSCWLQTSIGILYDDSSYVGGYCIGSDAKVTCTENLPNMYYLGNSGSAITNVATIGDCMKLCDADSTCMGWSYSSQSKSCWPQTTVYGKISDSQYMGGSCIKKQSPYPAITLDTYRQQALDTHNSFRSAHGAPNLVLDSDLNDIAQKYAEKLAQTRVFEHSGNTLNGNAIGENIYEITGLSQPMYAKGSDPSTSWYNEIKGYDFSNPGFGEYTGHFTQVVWIGTQRLGIGRALTSDNATLYTVANYYPPGNVQGGYVTNVLKPL
ncbi:unnamed protein product [Adineta ricciae]|uniref:Apple domain-containing protein n=1 Tax=Adineta ricciae TaxID=249248 RepID=A0A815E196_ADIRI|nr:unnamed protein product [Adineta ricciae]CAF1578996.1 unnamed protein product [Adineta ricciae]